MESNLPEPKSHATVVPWRTQDEFINVYEKLYSTKLEDKRWAIDTIHIWESRCHAGLPTAIEATYCLVRAVIQDTLFNENLTFMIEKDLVSMYAVGLIRFVNLRTEHLQNASFKLRVSDLAEKMDIPQWIVNLRHTATHSSFPPLDHLRFGAVKALKYLEDNFWKTDAGHMKQLRNLRTNFEQEVLELFDQYKAVQLQWIRNQDPEMSSKFGKDLKEITKKMNYMTNTVLKRIEFISIITRLSVFTAAEILKIIGDPNDPFLIEEEEITLPVKLEKFWLPLIRFIHRKGELIRFLVELLGKNGERHIFCQKFVVGLTRIIMFDSSTLAATKAFFSNNPLMTSSYSWKKIIYACAMGVNKYSMELAKLIAETKINDAHKYTELFVLMAMKTGHFISPKIKQMNAEQAFCKQLKDVKDGIVFTLEDTLNDVEELKAKNKGLNSLKNSIRLYTGPIDFSQIPIGTVLNPIVPKEDQTKEDICLVEIRPSPHDQCIFGGESSSSEEDMELTEDDKWENFVIPEDFDIVCRK